MNRASRTTAIFALSVLSWAIAAIPPALAQGPRALSPDEMPIDEQPGVIPDPDADRRPSTYQIQPVFYRTTEQPGTIVIDTPMRFLYLVQGNNRALRYGIGVGREGFQWGGLLRISRKAEWPDWVPPPEMI